MCISARCAIRHFCIINIIKSNLQKKKTKKANSGLNHLHLPITTVCRWHSSYAYAVFSVPVEGIFKVASAILPRSLLITGWVLNLTLIARPSRRDQLFFGFSFFFFESPSFSSSGPKLNTMLGGHTSTRLTIYISALSRALPRVLRKVAPRVGTPPSQGPPTPAQLLHVQQLQPSQPPLPSVSTDLSLLLAHLPEPA